MQTAEVNLPPHGTSLCLAGLHVAKTTKLSNHISYFQEALERRATQADTKVEF
jgi:hypothetical protein